MSDTKIVTGQYLVWMWQHYSLSLFPCDTLEDAVRLSEAIQDSGDGSPECIEGPEGIVAEETIEEIVRHIEAERSEEIAQGPKYTHFIRIKSPDGASSAQWGWYTSQDEAATALADLAVRFGERVSLHAVSH